MPQDSEAMARLRSCTQQLAQAVADTEFWHQRWSAEVEQDQQSNWHEIQERLRKNRIAAQSTYETKLAKLRDESAAITQTAGIGNAAWDDPLWDTWVPVEGICTTRFVRIGQLTETGIWDRLSLSTLLPLLDGHNLIIKASGEAKAIAINAIQAVALRLLALLPAGKVRLVCIDSSGRSQSAVSSPFPGNLGNVRILVDSQEITRYLVEHCEYILDLVQKDLRNEFGALGECVASPPVKTYPIAFW